MSGKEENYKTQCIVVSNQKFPTIKYCIWYVITISAEVFIEISLKINLCSCLLLQHFPRLERRKATHRSHHHFFIHIHTIYPPSIVIATVLVFLYYRDVCEVLLAPHCVITAKDDTY